MYFMKLSLFEHVNLAILHHPIQCFEIIIYFQNLLNANGKFERDIFLQSPSPAPHHPELYHFGNKLLRLFAFSLRYPPPLPPKLASLAPNLHTNTCIMCLYPVYLSNQKTLEII